MGKLKVVVPAVKHADGTISKAPNAKFSHEEIIKKTGDKNDLLYLGISKGVKDKLFALDPAFFIPTSAP